MDLDLKKIYLHDPRRLWTSKTLPLIDRLMHRLQEKIVWSKGWISFLKMYLIIMVNISRYNNFALKLGKGALKSEFEWYSSSSIKNIFRRRSRKFPAKNITQLKDSGNYRFKVRKEHSIKNNSEFFFKGHSYKRKAVGIEISKEILQVPPTYFWFFLRFQSLIRMLSWFSLMLIVWIVLMKVVTKLLI